MKTASRWTAQNWSLIKQTIPVGGLRPPTLISGEMKKMNKTNQNIDWARYSWNPVTGCRFGCPYCYADNERLSSAMRECPDTDRFQCLADALKLFRNKFNDDKSFLIWIARYYLRLKLLPMQSIFRLHSSNLCRISKKADRKLRAKK